MCILAFLESIAQCESFSLVSAGTVTDFMGESGERDSLFLP